MEKETQKISLKEDALNQAKWRNGVQTIVEGMGQIWPSLQGDNTK